jgi:hypothetical protein
LEICDAQEVAKCSLHCAKQKEASGISAKEVLRALIGELDVWGVTLKTLEREGCLPNAIDTPMDYLLWAHHGN